MKAKILVLFTLLAFVMVGSTGCKKKAQEDARVHGAWLIDADATIEQLSEEEREMAAAFIRLVKIGLVFEEDKSLLIATSMMGTRDEAKGTFEVLEVNEDDHIIQVTRAADPENGIEEDVSQIRVTFVSENQMRFRPVAQEGETEADMDRETLILKRVTAEELKAALDAPMEQPSLEQLFGGGLPPEALEALEAEAGADGQDEAPAEGESDAEAAAEGDAAAAGDAEAAAEAEGDAAADSEGDAEAAE